MNKKLWIIVAVLIIVLVAVILWGRQNNGMPGTDETATEDTGSIASTSDNLVEELEGVDLGDLDADLEAIDADLNNL